MEESKGEGHQAVGAQPHRQPLVRLDQNLFKRGVVLILLKQRHSPDAAVHNNLGNELHKLGRIDEAIVAYGEALRIAPDDALAHYNLGLALQKKQRFDEAVAEIRTALALEPADRAVELAVEAHYSLGRIHHRQGNIAEAITEYQEVLRLKPDHPFAAPALETLRQRREEPGPP